MRQCGLLLFMDVSQVIVALTLIARIQFMIEYYLAHRPRLSQTSERDIHILCVCGVCVFV